MRGSGHRVRGVVAGEPVLGMPPSAAEPESSFRRPYGQQYEASTPASTALTRLPFGNAVCGSRSGRSTVEDEPEASH